MPALHDCTPQYNNAVNLKLNAKQFSLSVTAVFFSYYSLVGTGN